VLSLGAAARRFFLSVEVDEATARAGAHGRTLRRALPVPDAPVALLSAEGALLALYRQRGDVAVPVAVLTEAG
jgi:hypothetical protein